jgi:hypothetical protein
LFSSWSSKWLLFKVFSFKSIHFLIPPSKIHVQPIVISCPSVFYKH